MPPCVCPLVVFRARREAVTAPADPNGVRRLVRRPRRIVLWTISSGRDGGTFSHAPFLADAPRFGLDVCRSHFLSIGGFAGRRRSRRGRRPRRAAHGRDEGVGRLLVAHGAAGDAYLPPSPPRASTCSTAAAVHRMAGASFPPPYARSVGGRPLGGRPC